MKILHLDSSILGDGSVTRDLSSAIVRKLRPLYPKAEVIYRDLAATPLPHITLEARGSDLAQTVLSEFESADVVVVGAPMYNFGISSLLKAWFDHIVIAGRTFAYGPDGAIGLAGGKRVLVAHARGGLYGPGMPGEAVEFSERYLRGILGFIGVTEPEFIVAEGLALGDEARLKAITAAHEAIASLDAGLAAAA